MATPLPDPKLTNWLTEVAKVYLPAWMKNTNITLEKVVSSGGSTSTGWHIDVPMCRVSGSVGGWGSCSHK